MASFDEEDQVTTVYEGSFGAANFHIQQNTTEKTRAAAYFQVPLHPSNY